MKKINVSKKKAQAKLEELRMYLGMCRYRRASVFPGPGIDEDEARLLKQIKELKEKYDL